MWHKYQDEGSCLIGLFKFLQEWEASMQCGQEVGPVGKSVEEANRSNGPGLQNHSPLLSKWDLKLDHEELECSSLECPSRFERFLGVVGPSSQDQVQKESTEYPVCQ